MEPHDSNARRQVYDPRSKYIFDGFMPMYPGRAVMSWHHENGHALRLRDLSRHLRDNAGPARLGEADKSRPGGRLRLFENSAGLFVVQIRGGLSDCMVPGLSINQKNGKLSFEWRDLFARFFGEKKTAESILKDAPVGLQGPPRQIEPGADKIEVDKLNQPSLQIEQSSQIPASHISYGISRLKPSLRAAAQSDVEMYYRHQWELEAQNLRLQRLRTPIQTWSHTAGFHPRHPRMSISRCRAQHDADEEANLDDEGAINEARIYWELESNHVANTARMAEWDKRTLVHTKLYPLSWLLFSLLVRQACDSCREKDVTCETKAHGEIPCDFCATNSWQCEFALRSSNGILIPAGSNRALQDYQMQMMLLEQQNKKRLLARQTPQTPQNPPYAGPSSSLPSPSLSAPNSQQYYGMQLMLLERQCQRRFQAAQQERDTALSLQAQPQP